MIARTLRRTMRRAAEHAPDGLIVIRGPAHRRRIALSFDDGPDERTIEYLELFDRLGVTVTFFLIGEACARHPELVREIGRRGHELASHGYSHRTLPSLPLADLRDELARTSALLPPARGRPMVRPPRGAVSLRSLYACARAGYRTVLWSLDSDDCRTREPDEVVARVAPARVRPGEIVLLHEGQPWTLAALPPMIAGLRGAGYDLVPIGRLLDGTG